METFILKRLRFYAISIIFLFTFYSTAFNQEDMKDISVSPPDNSSPHSIYAGMLYGRNMIYMGSNFSQDKPYFSGMLVYGFKENLFFSASATHMAAFEKPISYYSFTGNYSHTFNSWFDISAVLSGFVVNKSLADTLFSNFIYGSFTAGFDWKILYTNISAGGIFSETSSPYFNLKNSRYFETPSFMKGKAYFSFEPYVNIMLGKLTKTTTSEGTVTGVSAPFKPSGRTGQHSSGTIVTTYLGMIEADFGLPVTFNAGRLSLEVEPGYILPAYKISSDDLQSPEGFTLLISLLYRIF